MGFAVQRSRYIRGHRGFPLTCPSSFSLTLSPSISFSRFPVRVSSRRLSCRDTRRRRRRSSGSYALPEFSRARAPCTRTNGQFSRKLCTDIYRKIIRCHRKTGNLYITRTLRCVKITTSNIPIVSKTYTLRLRPPPFHRFVNSCWARVTWRSQSKPYNRP